MVEASKAVVTTSRRRDAAAAAAAEESDQFSRKMAFYARFFFGMVVYFTTLLLIVVPMNLLQRVFTSIKGFNVFAFQTFGRLSMNSMGISIVLKGNKEWFQKGHPPCVYVSNHQSQLDTAIYSYHIPYRCVVIAKRSLLYVPIVNIVMWVTNTIYLNRSDRKGSVHKLTEAAAEIRDKKLSVIIFPEGTRNSSGGLLPFKKGAFHMAQQANVPIVPVVIQDYSKNIYNMRRHVLSSGTIEIDVLDPIDMSKFSTTQEAADYTRAQMLKKLTVAQAK